LETIGTEKSIEENNLVCKRCFRLKNYNEVSDVELGAEDFYKLIKTLSKKDGLIVKVVDIFDFSGSWIEDVIDIVGNNKDIVQSLVLTSDESSIIAGSTTYMSSQVNVNDKNGALKDYAIVATDVSHELLHTLRLAHPFERTQTADTKLLRVGPNSYISTPSTASNIGNNVMNYPMITIDGKTSTSQNALTKGQLNLMLKEIELQKQGYGIYKYNNKLTNNQNEKHYKHPNTGYYRAAMP